MERQRLLELVEQLGCEFERRGMTTELEALRLYYLALTKHLDRRHTVDVAWSEERTIDWLGVLRVAPYQDRFEVCDETFRCPCATRPTGFPDLSHIARSIVATEARFPGGKKVRCPSCGKSWLVLNENVSGAPR